MEAKSLAQGTPSVRGFHMAAVETIAAGETLKDKLAETELFLESCTLTVKEKAPEEAVVPAMVPVAELIASPAGSCPLT